MESYAVHGLSVFLVFSLCLLLELFALDWRDGTATRISVDCLAKKLEGAPPKFRSFTVDSYSLPSPRFATDSESFKTGQFRGRLGKEYDVGKDLQRNQWRLFRRAGFHRRQEWFLCWHGVWVVSRYSAVHL